MKKIIGFMMLLSVAVMSSALLWGCNPDDPPVDFITIDYASEVKLNTEKYPDLNDQGMLILSWDDDAKTMSETRTYKEEAKALYDNTKPTVIFVHGILIDGGRYGNNSFHLPPSMQDVADLNEDDYDAEGSVLLTKFWLEEGWNVLIFNYNRFADAEVVLVEDRIYSGNDGISYHLPEAGDEFSDNDASNYSIGQFFAAEYLRTTQDLGMSADKEIRISCHSMGGIVTVNGTRILCALAEDGQIAANLLPGRVALIDTYVGWVAGQEVAFDTITWSGESMEGRSKSSYYLDYIKHISQKGIALELYLMEYGSVPLASFDGVILEVMDYVATVVYNPSMYKGMDYVSNGHNAVMEWYMSSIRYDAPKIAGTSADGLSASSPKEVVSSLKGKVYYLKSADLYIDRQTQSEVDKDFYNVQ